MSADHNSEESNEEDRLKVPAAWAALEDAFENNAPEVHSYLHLTTGDVIRVVDGVAAPVTHARIVADPGYRRVDPVSSREQYRWMERFIATLDEGVLKQRLLQAIDGKGAFRRFKDVLVSYPVERERWFAFRTERLRMCMEGWLDAQGLQAVERPEWDVPSAPPPRAPTAAAEKSPRRPAQAPEPLRLRALELVERLPPADLEAACAYLEFLARRSSPPAASAGRAPAVVPTPESGPSVGASRATGRSNAEPKADETADAHERRDQA